MYISKILLHGVFLSVLASTYLMGVLLYNPRLFLQDYPKVIQQQVPPKTDQEVRLSLIVGILFLLLLFAVPFISTLVLKVRPVPFGAEVPYYWLFLNGFGVLFIFNLVDLFVLDWLVFCTLTPQFVVIPGTEDDSAYKDYGYHFRAFLVGTLLSVLAGLVIGGIVILL